MTPAPVIETARLTVFVPNASWIPELVRFHLENREHLEPWGPPMPPELFASPWWEARQAANEVEREAGRSLKLCFARRGERRLLGAVALAPIERSPISTKAMLGYAVAREEEGKGYVSEASAAVIAYAFDVLRLHRLWTTYDPTNTRSARVLERLGFAIEGHLRQSNYLRGAWRDQVLVARLAPDDAPPWLPPRTP